MNTQFAIPKVGSKIRVAVRVKDDYLFATSPYKNIYLDGVVVTNNKFVKPGWFTLRVQNEFVPVREIGIENVTDLQHADGTMAATSVVNVDIRTLEVKGSKGEIYTVVKEGNKVSCNCPGFTFRKACRHQEMIK